MPYRNNYWKSIIGQNAQVLISLGVAYTSQATYALFVANSVEGELGVFNNDTGALIAGNAQVSGTANIFIAVNRGGVKSSWANAPQVPNVIETSVIFQAQNMTAIRQTYDAPILQVTQVAWLSHASATIGDITYTAIAAGASSPITVVTVVSGASTALSVSVTSNAITVNAATNSGSAAISTAAQIVAAVNASTPAKALVFATVTGVASNVQAAQGSTGLTGGTAASTVTIGNIYGIRILETTIAFQQFPTWDYQYLAVAGDTEDTIGTKLAAQINSTTSIQNRDRDLVVTAAYAGGILTLTAIYFGSTFKVMFPGLQFPALASDNQYGNVATISTPQTCHAGSGAQDQVRMFQMAGDVYKGVTTQYPLQGAQPQDYGQPDDFVALNTVKNFDIFVLYGYKNSPSITFLHQQAFKLNIYIIVPTSGTTPTTAVRTIFGV